MACFERAIELKPQHPDYHTNCGILSLLLGNWERGLEEYEWRLKQRSVKPRRAATDVGRQADAGGDAARAMAEGDQRAQ